MVEAEKFFDCMYMEKQAGVQTISDWYNATSTLQDTIGRLSGQAEFDKNADYFPAHFKDFKGEAWLYCRFTFSGKLKLGVTKSLSLQYPDDTEKDETYVFVTFGSATTLRGALKAFMNELRRKPFMKESITRNNHIRAEYVIDVEAVGIKSLRNEGLRRVENMLMHHITYMRLVVLDLYKKFVYNPRAYIEPPEIEIIALLEVRHRLGEDVSKLLDDMDIDPIVCGKNVFA